MHKEYLIESGFSWKVSLRAFINWLPILGSLAQGGDQTPLHVVETIVHSIAADHPDLLGRGDVIAGFDRRRRKDPKSNSEKLWRDN